MTLPSEWELISRIKAICGASGSSNGLIAGIGDDCAVFRAGPDRYGLITTDISIEKVHFRRELCTPEQIGYKAMSGNISDIAAMGGKALFAFISLGLPKSTDTLYVESLYRGMLKAADPVDVQIAGGDISSSESMVISITVYGEKSSGLPIMRSGARPGDIIYITGTTGGSLAGLEILTGRKARADEYPALVERHVAPQNRIDCVPEIIDRFDPTAMIDISDGLLSDLRHLCESSGTGFSLDGDALPIPEGLDRYAHTVGKDPADYALSSGEEFELLFTSKKAASGPVTLKNGIAVAPIGAMTAAGFHFSRRGIQKEIEITGYDHFK